MKRKSILKTALLTSLLSLTLVSTVSASTTQSSEVDVGINPGEFSLTAPEVSKPFGAVELKAEAQKLHASFGGPFTVKDLRGTQEGWRLEVQADLLTNGTHTLPASSLTIEPVSNIVHASSVGGPGAEPTALQTAPKPVDGGASVGLVSAPEGSGMGVYNISLPDDALEVTVDAMTARTDGGVYETTLNWTLVQAP